MAMASRVGLSMGQIGIADPQNEVGRRAGRCCEHFQPFSRVDSDLKRCVQGIGTSPWAGQGNRTMEILVGPGLGSSVVWIYQCLAELWGRNIV